MTTKRSDSLDLSLTSLTAVTPLDGRYRQNTQSLAPFVSEFALIQARFAVEARYLIALSEVGLVRKLKAAEKELLRDFANTITLEIAQEVKEIEKETRHDVKAMERVFRKLIAETSLSDIIEMIHFGLTSEDVNNLAYRMLLYNGTQQAVIPVLEEIVQYLSEKAKRYASLGMLARTHGQAAIPTTVGKELAVFAVRLSKQKELLKNQKLTGKFSGAVGNFNALEFAYSKIDWISFTKKFISSFGFTPNLMTTQINSYDDVSEYLQIYLRINNILIDLDQDMWRYISDNWFVQEVKKGEVGSSTMPQKVNPIDFENSEGNLGLANALLSFMSQKLLVSRLQRDLSDSTVIRNIGTVLGYCTAGYKSTMIGLHRVRPNGTEITKALHLDWTILTEGVQTLLRKEGIQDPYSLIAGLTRGKHITQKEWDEWIDALPIDKKVKKQLTDLTPNRYVGLAEKLTIEALKEIQ